MPNIYILSIADDYYIDIAENLIERNCNIKMMGFSQDPAYLSSKINNFISKHNPKLILAENYNQPDRLNRILAPDYSCLTPDFLSKIAHYEKMFLLTTDRLSFFPISQLERVQLFYKYAAHFYKLLNDYKIDTIVNFGIPHGLYAITVFGLAKVMGIKVMYFDWIYIAAGLSLLETDIRVKRCYGPKDLCLGEVVSPENAEKIHTLIESGAAKKLPLCVDKGKRVDKTPKRKNKFFILIKRLLTLIFKRPFSSSGEAAFFLDKAPRTKLKYVLPTINYFLGLIKTVRFCDNNASNTLPGKNDIVLFLHFTPEASSMPVGEIFADQLLVIDILLQALPDGSRLFVKEHPMMFEVETVLYEQRHERSVDFYKKILSDHRVTLTSRSVVSEDLIEAAGVTASVCGSTTWEAMISGKPTINFGWAWFSACKSCHQVDSVETARKAIQSSLRSSPDIVHQDVDNFIKGLKKRAIYGASSHFALPYVDEEYSYHVGVNNIAKAIMECIK